MSDIATATDLPAGYSFDLDFGIFRSRISFVSDQELSFEVLTGSAAGTAMTVGYQVINLRPGLFVVTWQEPDNTTVVHVEDFAGGVVHANLTRADGSFLRLPGKILPAGS